MYHVGIGGPRLEEGQARLTERVAETMRPMLEEFACKRA
jgi:hypothetical protein